MSIELNLIYKRAHHYSALTGQTFEDLVQEGIVASLEAEISYDPTRGTKLSTWQWWQIEKRLQAYCKQAKDIIYSDLPPEPKAPEDPISFYEFHEWMMRTVPPDVQLMCRLVLDEPEEYAGCTPIYCQRRLRRLLAEKTGWNLTRINEAIQDAKAWFRHTGPPLRRTA